MWGRAPRPSKRGKAPPALSAANAAKFLHLQVLMGPDLLEDYTTFRAAPEQAIVGFSGSAQRLLWDGVKGLLLSGAAVHRCVQATNSHDFSR